MPGIKEINFNHNYKKLHNQTKAVLIQTAILKGKNIQKEFIDYDTDDQYKINKKEDYLYLVFVGDKMIPFTTLRKLNIENIKKYVGYEGDYFDVVVEEKEEPLPNHWVPM
jgi:hypothetical protein